MRKIFEDANSSDFIEFINDGEDVHMFINYPENKEINGEFIFNKNQVLQIISELSKILIK